VTIRSSEHRGVAYRWSGVPRLRARGIAPPVKAARQVLAVGAELKNTVSVAKESFVVCSHHIGDLGHLATYQAFLQATVHLCRLFGIEPEVVAHDLHPEYLSTKHALDLDLEPWPVQHHHAHIASCLAEHGHTDTVLGSPSTDSATAQTDDVGRGVPHRDFNGFERAAHLRQVAMPGGAAAVREPWRMALSWTACSLGIDAAARLGARLDPRWSQILPLAVGDGERYGSILTRAPADCSTPSLPWSASDPGHI